jgi:hypothetical protein
LAVVSKAVISCLLKKTVFLVMLLTSNSFPSYSLSPAPNALISVSRDWVGEGNVLLIADTLSLNTSSPTLDFVVVALVRSKVCSAW